ncbi:MAG: hypothetical protein GX915_00285 [Clostridiales bacterium]|nr:hypothetical protein [Clostridiales bacterium]
MENRVCKKCLIRDMDEYEEYKNMFEYIRNISDDIKSSQELYEERMEICKECDMLLSGMCRKCGCFVEMRAAVEKNYCPGKKW